MTKNKKTNALRMLDKANIPYTIETYSYDETDLSGVHVIGQVSLKAEQIFKTLVLQSASGEYLVCCLPVLKTLALKKVAKASHFKSVAMLPVKELLPLTGYMRGGCSPIGMKKVFPTYFDQSILEHQIVAFSAGKRGEQMLVHPQDIIAYLQGQVVEISEE